MSCCRSQPACCQFGRRVGESLRRRESTRSESEQDAGVREGGRTTHANEAGKRWFGIFLY